MRVVGRQESAPGDRQGVGGARCYGRSRQARIARGRSPIPKLTRKNLLNPHIDCFNSEAESCSRPTPRSWIEALPWPDISVKKYIVKLSEVERSHLQGLINKGKSPARRLPLTFTNRRTIGCVPSSGALCNRSWRAASICRICSGSNRCRSISRRSAAMVLGGIGSPSGVCKASGGSAAFLSAVLKPRMPSRTQVAFMRLTSPLPSPKRPAPRWAAWRLLRPGSGSRRFCSESRSPRSHPRKARFSISAGLAEIPAPFARPRFCHLHRLPFAE